jgi:hypothetical protein
MSFHTWIVCVAAAFVTVSSARGASDGQWDGLDELVRVASEAGVVLKTGPKIDLAQVSASDALLIVGPTSALPVSGLTTFLREGGRIALLDDLGSGDRLLSAYQVARSAAPKDDLPALRGNEELLVAYPASEHPLVEGVSMLLTNRAASLQHPELKPVFTFGRSPHALVLAGAVGGGRLVAVGDASVLINQLMTLSSHRRFAKNLLEYLSRPGGRIWLVGPDSELAGSYGSRKAGLSRIDGWLRRVSHPDLPPAVLSLIGLSLCGIAVVLAVGTLPRRSPYVRPDLFPQALVFAGFAGRVAAAEREGVNLAWSVLDYKRELEAELTYRLGLDAPFDAREAVRIARARGLSEVDSRALADLLARLDRLATAHDAEEKMARVDGNELGNVVRQGEQLLGRVENSQA